MSVGTDFHPFNRLVEWTDDWLLAHPEFTPRTLIQHGSSTPPTRACGATLVAYPQLQAAMSQASALVCHAGPATVFEARRHGLTPICVARDPDLGEHVDHHQQRFAQHMSAAGLVHWCENRETYFEALDAELVSRSVAAVGSSTSAVPSGVQPLAELVESLSIRTRRLKR
ncbi:MAG: glycosyltransferase [Ornithinimicrobium sp.]